jgi:photosystem II stability/assembly factor-like uncharacterized protein
MKKNFRLLGISLLGVALVACIAVTSLTPAPPAAPALLPTSTAFSPAATVLPPTNTTIPTAVVPANTVISPTETSVPGPAVPIYQIHMLDQANGWGWTSQPDGSSRILRTQNGGATWSDVSPQGQALTPYSSSFLDAQAAWIAQYDPATNANLLLRTTDGGKTWVSLPQNEIENANYQFTSPNDGVAESAGVGAGNLYLNLYETHDGGASWSPILIAAPDADPGLPAGTVHLCSICGDSLYYDPARLVITYGDLASDPGGAVRLSISTDLGQHWTGLNLPLPDQKYADGLVAPKSPIFFGNDGLLPVSIGKYNADGALAYNVLVVYATHDGGQSWSQAAAILENSAGFFDSVQVLSPQEAFVRCGKNLCATHDGAQTWLTLPASLDFDINSSGSFVSQFQFIDPKTGWAVVPAPDGSNYALWKSSDGGATWTQLSPTLAQ